CGCRPYNSWFVLLPFLDPFLDKVEAPGNKQMLDTGCSILDMCNPCPILIQYQVSSIEYRRVDGTLSFPGIVTRSSKAEYDSG
ncbi:MAG: hypothetical protein KAT27_06860, partial [Desulfobacterales bacterium]|nr:hypothetical protein [Desulfobacterales bacterium]